MKVIKRTIPLNKIRSRLPGILPSLVDSWVIPSIQIGCDNILDEEIVYGYANAVNRAQELGINPSRIKRRPVFKEVDETNYGLIVSDVIIPSEIAAKITDYTDIYVNIPDNNGGFYDLSWPKSNEDPHYEGRKIMSGGTEIKVLTYQTLNKWYCFFNDYFKILNSEYPKIYDNALSYYEETVNGSSQELYNYYSNLDATFASRGGDEMYEWIIKNCILRFNIPDEFIMAWNTEFIYYSDALKWYKWFDERNSLYSELTSCEEANDCCDCQEYVKRGGIKFFNILKEWVDSINLQQNSATYEASYPITINFDVSIDDLGEMSILSKDWEESVDYSNQTISKNAGVGTVANRPYLVDNETFETTVLNDTFINNGYDKGYVFDEEYFENLFDEDAWQSYTDYYVSGHPEEINPTVYEGETVRTYAFHPLTNKVVYNPSSNEDEKMGVKYPITLGEIVVINGNIYPVFQGKYVRYCYEWSVDLKLKNKLFPVYSISETSHYVDINGVRYFSEINDSGKEVFYFSKNNNCLIQLPDDNGCEISDKAKYIFYQNTMILASSDGFHIEEIMKDRDVTTIYPILNGYCDIDNVRWVISGSSIVVNDEEDNEVIDDNSEHIVTKQKWTEVSDLTLYNNGWKTYSISDDYVTVIYRYDEYDCFLVTGYTDSKLEILRRHGITVDEMNNELPGYFNIKMYSSLEDSDGNSKYIKPYEGCRLDLLFYEGMVSCLEENDELPDGSFFGNILTNMELFYYDELGNKTTVQWNNLNDIEQAINDHTDVYFDITYHIGAVINKITNQSDYSVTYELDNTHLSGVKYVDTLKITDERTNYYMADGNSFVIKYFELNQNIDNNGLYDYPKTKFEMALTAGKMITSKTNGTSDISCNGGNVEFSLEDGKNVRDYVAAPVFRQEFNLGSSYYQNIESDIYIDRGMASAIDRHLKLQEIRTLESMENYANGSTFNLIQQ